MQRLRVYRAACESETRLDPDAAAALEREFFDRIDDDLDTPGALRLLDEALASTRSEDGMGVRAAALLPRLLDLVGAGTGVASVRTRGA